MKTNIFRAIQNNNDGQKKKNRVFTHTQLRTHKASAYGFNRMIASPSSAYENEMLQQIADARRVDGKRNEQQQQHGKNTLKREAKRTVVDDLNDDGDDDEQMKSKPKKARVETTNERTNERTTKKKLKKEKKKLRGCDFG